MRDHEHRAAGRERLRGTPEHEAALVVRDLEVERDDEVEPGRRAVVEQVGRHPFDLDAPALGELRRLREPDLARSRRR